MFFVVSWWRILPLCISHFSFLFSFFSFSLPNLISHFQSPIFNFPFSLPIFSLSIRLNFINLFVSLVHRSPPNSLVVRWRCGPTTIALSPSAFCTIGKSPLPGGCTDPRKIRSSLSQLVVLWVYPLISLKSLLWVSVAEWWKLRTWNPAIASSSYAYPDDIVLELFQCSAAFLNNW